MASLEKSLRNQLERTVKDARDIAESGAKAALEAMGVGEAGPPSHLNDEDRDLRRRLRIHGRQLGDLQDEKKKTQELDRLIEEVGYEQWNRMLFARFLAENNLLIYPDPHSPVAVSLAECEDLAVDEGARNGWELAARFAAKMLPQIFRVDSPVFELTLPPEVQQQLAKLISDLPVDVFTASDSLGWVYQFWQARRKDQVNASEVKIGARELPAVTQLFTEDYMVDFLLDNTLGAWWAGKVLATNAVLGETAKCEDELRNAVVLSGCPWAYLRISKPENGNWSPAAGTFEGWPRTASELKCLDPCMGSGHFVVAMFERLVALRMAEEQLDQADAIAAVIRDNLYGLEIDPRCTQIAAFNLALAAWRRVGYCVLPPMNLACSGLAPNTTKAEWLGLAGDNEKLQNGMERLFDLFEQAPVLGSLINPRADKGDLLEAAFHELQPLLEKALAQETRDDTTQEMAVTARGLAKAAEILAGQFTLVATNVPYLGRGKQDDSLREYCDNIHSAAKADLATCFLERCMKFCAPQGTSALVSPQNWWFLGSYSRLRHELLINSRLNFIITLGEEAWQSFADRGPVATLMLIDQSVPRGDHSMAGIDALPQKTIHQKITEIKSGEPRRLLQRAQHGNPDHRITIDQPVSGPLLQKFAASYAGIQTGDYNRFGRLFWEFESKSADWEFQQSTVEICTTFGGREHMLRWEEGRALVGNDQARIQGLEAFGKCGIAISQMRNLAATIFTGEIFDNNCAAVVIKDAKHIAALWAYCDCGELEKAVRRIDQKVSVTNATFVKVPFDLAHWQKVAAERYPHGLPKPFSSDPTQWLFIGHPHASDNPLQVAVARLVGYEWPRQTGSSFPDCPSLGPDGLEILADKDGIVCIPPVRGESGAADRLLNLLANAYGNEWTTDVLGQLLSNAGYAGKSLETWLRDGFFAQHIDLFNKRPFIWHIWDGLRDGFSALVNYHKLDQKNLETLIYTYLGDWITRCESADKDNGLTEDGEKTTAAKNLKRKLEQILEGEAPYDIFVRWKPLHEQPIGWEPDLNDGVRMNIRPFLSVPDVKVKGAGILRVNPKIKWDKDRGKEPQRSKDDYPWFWGWDGKTTDFPGGPEFKGERFNDCHYTLARKRKAKDSRQ
jgi:hypothetical protein